MFQLIVSLLVAVILQKADLPSAERNFSLPPASASVSEQKGGDAISSGRLPLAKEKDIPQKINQNSLGVEVAATNGLVVDWDSGQALWSKNPEEKSSIASLTKIMTALVFLDHNPGWETKIKILSSDQREGGAAFLGNGEEVTVRDLFYLALVKSINSAAAALARSTGLSEKDFVAAMNQKAQELGLNDTVFVDPTGLYMGNISTAVDLAVLFREALQKTAIANATTMEKYQVSVLNKDNGRNAESTDILLASYLNKDPYRILGGKTGYTEEAGYCLVLGVEKSGRKIISVMLGSNSIDNRFNDTKGIVDWAFRNYQW